MSFQEEEKEITDLRQKEQKKTDLSSLEIHIHDYENVISSSTRFPQKKIRFHQGISMI